MTIGELSYSKRDNLMKHFRNSYLDLNKVELSSTDEAMIVRNYSVEEIYDMVNDMDVKLMEIRLRGIRC
tara:strand:- start:277 stop:483 length:207 start_codon:yes stop_codon:yes gene_type:complete